MKELTKKQSRIIHRYNRLTRDAAKAKQQLIEMLKGCELGEHPCLDHHIINTEERALTREQWEAMS